MRFKEKGTESNPHTLLPSTFVRQLTFTEHLNEKCMNFKNDRFFVNYGNYFPYHEVQP